MDNSALKRYLTKLMIMLGFSPRHFGFSYIREMVICVMREGERKLGNVYPQVAQKHDQPIDAVQTAVRTALKAAQETPFFAQFETLLGTKFIEPRYHLAPREFISLMVEYLVYVWDGEENFSL